MRSGWLHRCGCFWLFLVVMIQNLVAQEASFKVMISADKLQPGDTLDLMATYALGDRALPPATLAACLQAPDGSIRQMRWPMVEGKAAATLLLPADMPEGRYHLMLAVVPRFLQFTGKVLYPEKVKALTAVLQSGILRKEWEVPVKPGGRLDIQNVYFEQKALLSFEHEAGTPLVMLEAWLDSAFMPAAYNVKQLVISKPGPDAPEPESVNKSRFFNDDFSVFESKEMIRRNIRRFSGLSGPDLYDSLYVPVAFRQTPARLLNSFSDTVLLNHKSVYEWLQTNMRGLMTEPWAGSDNFRNNNVAVPIPYGEMMVYWKGEYYRLYHRGMYGDAALLLYPPEAFAAVKVFAPPFPASAGNAARIGVIAFFEKKFPFMQPFPYHHQFEVTGYTPEWYILSADHD